MYDESLPARRTAMREAESIFIRFSLLAIKDTSPFIILKTASKLGRRLWAGIAPVTCHPFPSFLGVVCDGRRPLSFRLGLKH